MSLNHKYIDGCISTHSSIDHGFCCFSFSFQLPLNAPQTATMSNVAMLAQPPVVTLMLPADAKPFVWRRARVTQALSETGMGASPNPNVGATTVRQGATCQQERPSGPMTSVMSSALAIRQTTKSNANWLAVLMGNCARWSTASEIAFPTCLQPAWSQAILIS